MHYGKIPEKCIVFGCTVTTFRTGGGDAAACDTKMLWCEKTKKFMENWVNLVKLKYATRKPNEHSEVCPVHFTGEKYKNLIAHLTHNSGKRLKTMVVHMQRHTIFSYFYSFITFITKSSKQLCSNGNLLTCDFNLLTVVV